MFPEEILILGIMQTHKFFSEGYILHMEKKKITDKRDENFTDNSATTLKLARDMYVA